MNKLLTLLFLVGTLLSCTEKPATLTVSSPSGNNSIDFQVTDDGAPIYLVNHKDKVVIDTSSMGFDFKDQESIKNHLKIIGSSTNTVNETWEMPWGEQKDVVNHYNELKVELEETQAPNRKINVYFRAYDDGVGFRYEFLPQQGIDSIIIMDENTEFQLTEDYTSFWIPGDWDIYEHLYNTSKVSEIDAIAKRNNADLAQSNIPENAVNTPVTMRSDSGLHLSFHEANLTDYAGMTLKVDNETLKLTSELVGSDRLGYKVKRALPFKTPWRTIQIADKATELIDSKLIVNLNEPNKIGDVSWFKPKKYVGIWWEMHIGKSTWDYAASQDMNSFTTDAKPHGKHGATTENTKHYIDFAAKNNITGVLVEGWNTGWEHWIGFEDREGVFDFITPYPDYDLEEVTRYGKEKGVELIMHHETSAAPRTYEQQLDTAYQLMHKLGIHSVKTGYVGKIIPKGEYHHGQWMVNHYRKVVETGAKYQVAVNAHEPIKATGLRRTYPNVIAREGLRGQEFNAWASDGGNPPEHLPIVAFTRMLAGPIDFTPGVFDIALPTKPNNQINTTLAQQLALYVVIYSPIQMACDLPENYENQPAFQFIRDVGVDWDKTVVLNGEVGDFVTIARKERETGNWFVGGITDENARDIDIDFDFLDDGVDYEAIIYKDAADANYKENPTAISIENIDVKKGSTLSVHLVEGGGFAISLIKKNKS
ncbi:glycoside hydrolase family 97 protein [Flagellimonas aequoris]|uniref:Glycoside hydrolase family 97 protein n=1 Tax=Flagellimonas aequoris TaxID=2306997 RepID=A0A418N659_9FLAO|nr:glycoside hydrolase family 97 protein [Allomuricauda aequoris]RIV69815.1 glycoside hydrolase family 97 protein [Allomuricauda aequoris]TXK01397.1 glycoside hydrolase family 97 protein [Allomuricauda aequoris]